MKKTLFRTSLLLISATLLLCIFLIGCSSSDKPADRNFIQSVSISENRESIEIVARFTPSYAKSRPDSSVFLLEFSADEVEGISSSAESGGLSQYLSGENKKTPLLSHDAAEKAVFTIPAKDGVRSRLYSAFLVVEYDESGKLVPLTDVSYVTNADSLAPETNEDFSADTDSIKGLITDSAPIAQSLGASSTVIDVSYTDFIKASGERNSETYVFDGITYFFDRDSVAELDRKVKSFSESNVKVYLNFVLKESENSDTDFLYLEKGGSNPYFAVNMGDAQASRHMCAFFEFMAERYTRSDGEYGLAYSYILGKNANALSTFNNISGESVSPELYIENYVALLRVANTALISNCSYGQVFASFNNNFSNTSSLLGVDMNVKNFMRELCRLSSSCQDFNFGVAMSMSIDSTDIGQSSTDSGDFITPDNFSDLTMPMATKDFLCNGEMRPIIISDLKISPESSLISPPESETSDGESETESKSETETEAVVVTSSISNSIHDRQALAYTYTFYRAVENGSIDALIYGSAIDSSDSDGTGLMYPSSTAPYSELIKRGIYYAFAEVDTPNTDYLGRFMSEFTDLYRRQKDNVISRNYISGSAYDDYAIGEDGGKGKYTVENLFSFDNGSHFGFTVSDGNGFLALSLPSSADLTSENSEFVKPNVPVLSAVLQKQDGYAAYGVSKNSITLPAERDTRYIAVTFKADSGTNNSACYVRLRLSDVDSALSYESKSVAVLNGKWYTLYFDISEFSKDRNLSENPFSLSFEITNEAVESLDQQTFVSGNTASLSISKIDICSIDTSFPILAVIFIIIGAVLFVGIVVTVTAVYSGSRKRRNSFDPFDGDGSGGFGPAVGFNL